MLKRYCTRVFVLFFFIFAAGCTSTGTGGTVGMDGRIKNMDDLAARMSQKYNRGLKKVANAQTMSKHHQHYGDFALTLFNVRANKGDLADMIGTFRNYCWYLGGVQRERGLHVENPNSFSLICEPKELREVGKYRSRHDPAYYIYFVNVVLVQKFQSEKVAKSNDINNAKLYITNRYDAHRQNAHLDKPKIHEPQTRLANGYYTGGYPTGYPSDYRHSIGYYANSQHKNGYSTILPHSHSYYKDSLTRKSLKANPRNTYYPDTNPYTAISRPAKPVNANAGNYCVNFLVNENQTYNKAFSDMPNLKEYRKLFISILNKTKAYC